MQVRSRGDINIFRFVHVSPLCLKKYKQPGQTLTALLTRGGVAQHVRPPPIPAANRGPFSGFPQSFINTPQAFVLPLLSGKLALVEALSPQNTEQKLPASRRGRKKQAAGQLLHLFRYNA